VVLPLVVFLVGAGLVTSCRPHGHGHRDPEAMREHAEFAADWALGRVDATEEQKAEVQAILDRTLADVSALRGDHGALHEAAVAELTAPTIDRDALEALRAEQVAELEEASRTIVEGVADIATVLTVEQRLELAELAERFHGRRRWRH
jgi:Spy/CpxP family protein refolding chaperone